MITAVLDAMDRNLASHASHLHHELNGASVLDHGDLLIAYSGLAHDTFNTISRARFTESNATSRIITTLQEIRRMGAPFSWWVGPSSSPIDLAERISRAGLEPSETEEAMVAEYAAISLPSVRGDIQIRTVKTSNQLSDYAFLVASNWNPMADDVARFYELARAAILDDGCASKFLVAYVQDEPVAGAEIHLAHGVAGLYSVVTLVRHRRQGYGTAVTHAALQLARDAGYPHVVLQASVHGAPIYRRLGFVTIGQYTEFSVQPIDPGNAAGS